ncbi:MAG: hypothetical protein IPK80_21095 [Nannocystis sp.]|nr:hypothetical protein [Nannocystis sp.]
MLTRPATVFATSLVAFVAACPWPETADQNCDVEDCTPTASDANGTTPTTADPQTSTTAGEGDTTGTGATSDTGDTTDGGDELLPEDPPPTIISFEVKPTTVTAAGPLKFTTKHSADVVSVEIWRDDQVLPLEKSTPWSANQTYQEHPITNAPGDEGEFLYKAIVLDAQGQIAISEPVVVKIELPEAGSVVFHETLEPDPALLIRATAIAQHSSATYIGSFAASIQDKKVIVDPQIRAHNNSSGEVFAELKDLPKQAILMAMKDVGPNFIAAGYTYENNWTEARPWAQARVAPSIIDGAWMGAPGAHVEAVASLPDTRVVLVGTTFTGPNNNKDVQVWIGEWDLDNVTPVLTWENMVDINPMNPAQDQAFAVAVTKDGAIVIAGETQVEHPVQLATNLPRAFVLRLSAEGEVGATWLAPKGLGTCSSALGMSLDHDGGILVAGWSSSDLGAPRIPMLLRLNEELEFETSWFDISNTGPRTEARRVFRSPSGHLIAGLTFSGNGEDDLVILGADPLQKFIEPLWTYTAPLVQGEHQHLRDLFVDRYGYVHAVGWLGDLRSSAVRLNP